MLESSNLIWNVPHLVHGQDINLLSLSRLFRPSLVLPSLASNCFGIFAAVKSVTDNSTLGVAESFSVGHQWTDGQWLFEMGINWRTDRSSVVKHFDLGNEVWNGDRWIIKTFIEIYLWSVEGLTKIGDAYLTPPSKEDLSSMAFGSGEDLGAHMHVTLHADVVTFSIADVEANVWSKDWAYMYFDEDAKNKAVAALSKNWKLSCLEHEPVLKAIRDSFDEQ